MEDLCALLQSQPLFQGAAAADVRALIAASELRDFPAGALLLEQGAESDSALLILDGEVGVSVQTDYGPVELTTLSGVTLLGEIGVLADLPRTATIRALTAGRLLWMTRAAFTRVGHDNPAVLRWVVAQLGSRIGAFNRAVGFYTNALAALEHDELDPKLLAGLMNPPPELLGFAVTFRKMAEQIVLRRAHRQEMESAAAIQRAMLPDPLPDDGPRRRFELHARMRPAREVGGDFYDAFPIGPDHLAVTIGDVSGKGVPASLFMAVCQTIMRLVLGRDGDLGLAIGRANDLLGANNREAMFATFFGAVLDLRTGRLTYCNCGHNPPLIVRRDGRCEALGAPDLPLAVFSPLECSTRTTTLGPGDRILLYTDGATEAHGPGERLFGEERLQAAVLGAAGLPPRDMVDAVFRAVDAFADGVPQFDDVACLVLARAEAGTGA